MDSVDTSTMDQEPQTTTYIVESPDGAQVDVMFIVAMASCAIGGALVIGGFLRLSIWLYRIREVECHRIRHMKHLQHMRYLEQYSIKAGGSPNECLVKKSSESAGSGRTDSAVFNWDELGINQGFVGDDTIERLGAKGPVLEAHIRGSNGGRGEVTRQNSQALTSNGDVIRSNGAASNGHVIAAVHSNGAIANGNGIIVVETRITDREEGTETANSSQSTEIIVITDDDEEVRASGVKLAAADVPL